MSERKLSNPKDRTSTTKLDLSLFPDTAVAYGALAMTEGDLKYGGFNFRKDGVSFNTYISACRGHLASVYNGEWHDPDTGVPHLANALACIAVLIDASECGMLIDDRPPSTDTPNLRKEFMPMVERLQKLYPNPPKRITWRDVSVSTPVEEEPTNIAELEF